MFQVLKIFLISVKKCIASLFTDRAISYRKDKGFSNTKVYLSVGVQKMARSDLASSGVAFTIDTETGFDKVSNHKFVLRTWRNDCSRKGQRLMNS